MNDVERDESKNSSIADRCFMRQNLGAQKEKASDPHLKSTDGERERERAQCRLREYMEWEASMTRPSRKISTGKSI